MQNALVPYTSDLKTGENEMKFQLTAVLIFMNQVQTFRVWFDVDFWQIVT